MDIMMGSEGERRRDRGVNQTAANNHAWLEEALVLVRRHAPSQGRTFMAEEFRTYPGIGSPTHPNAWGALTRTALSRGIIKPTGQWAKAISARNHAHYYKVYERGPGSP